VVPRASVAGLFALVPTMNCFMFPGQPLTRSTPLPHDSDFKEVADLVRRTAGLDLARFEWVRDSGSESVKLQVFGVARSLYALRRLRHGGIAPDIVTQHSMGIYAALAACGCVSEEVAVEITWRVGKLLERMRQEGRFALGCVSGLTLEPLLSVACNHGVHLANHNTSRHFLLCGKKDDLTRAAAEAFENGAFSIRTFDCDAPLHTPLMAPLEDDLNAVFRDYRYAEPNCPLIDHLEQGLLTAATIPDFMLRELCLPVYWDRTYLAARTAGGRHFFEVGAGDSLKKYNRWIEAELES
jgi:[acyl-carrier-protein] S-malonyltransferase